MYTQKIRGRGYHHPIDEPDMGHFTTLRTPLRDSDLLIAALTALEIPVQVDVDVRGSNGQRVRAEIVAVLEGRFDIGFTHADDGPFNMIVDLWGLAQRYDNVALINGIYQQYRALKEQAETPE